MVSEGDEGLQQGAVWVLTVGYMAHARRKFHELWANHGSQVGEQALKFFGQLYEVERAAVNADSQARFEARRAARPLADALNQWLRQQRQRVPDGSATARAIDYSLKRWAALTRYLDDGDLPVDTAVFDKRFRYVPFAAGVAPRAGRRSFHPATKRRYSASACSSHARSWSRTVFRL
jgi:hypothetical protein